MSSEIVGTTDFLETDYVSVEAINANMQAITDYLESLYGKLFYEVGDTVSLGSINTAGYLTSAKTSIAFTIPLAHIVTASSVSLAGSLRVRQNETYIIGSASSYETVDFSASLNTSKDFIRVSADVTTTSSATNNGPVGIVATGLDATFS